jgi:hypothetical protein
MELISMALRLTKPQTEISIRNISLGIKAAGEQGWQPRHLHALIVLKSGSLNLLEPSRPVQASKGIALRLRVTEITQNYVKQLMLQ